MTLDFTKVGQNFSMDLDSWPGEYPIREDFNRPIERGLNWAPAIGGAVGGGLLGNELSKFLKLKGLLRHAGPLGLAYLGAMKAQDLFR